MSSPFFRHDRMLSTQVLILEQKKILQVSSNDQKVEGVDVSYMKSVPPIGAPKAALTPAAAPAQAIYRFVVSCLNFFKKLKGR